MRVDPSSWQVVTPGTQRTTLSRSPTTSQALSADARIQTVLRVLGMRSLRLTANAGFTVYDDGQWPDSSVREGGSASPLVSSALSYRDLPGRRATKCKASLDSCGLSGAGDRARTDEPRITRTQSSPPFE